MYARECCLKRSLPTFIAILLFGWTGSFTYAQSGQAATPAIEAKTAGLEKIDGYFPLYWDEKAGTLWMEINRLDKEVLNLGGLAAGLGSNDVGLDRGQGGGSRIVSFERVGPKILMIQPNYRFRASSDNPDEVKAVTDAFARSTLWGFKVAAETDGRVLVDMTDYLLRDTHNVIPRLRRSGNYRVDKSRSAVFMPMTMNFPKNTEIEVTVTYISDDGGGGGGLYEGAGAVAASGSAVTLRIHHSFVELPDDNYTPRLYDPRSGYGALIYRDYATPLGEPMDKRLIRRHRLYKKDPNARVSDPVEPIIYYLDRGTPEPIRSALLTGARWWNQAFEAAGYRNAFQVELLPEGASSHDIRYNVINWVHRSTRGWSYGGSVTDPRTGEIIKGVVVLGSLRVRQDYMIGEGLLAPYENGDEVPTDIAEWALARIRQLGAHEVGHTIGLGHNYYDSRQGRISVLDYPHPLVTLKSDGTFDYSEVYDVGIGAWDKVSVTYGYQDFPDGTNEVAALKKILNDAWEDDIIYLSNQDMSANPKVDQWSNGNEPAAELNRMMQVRRAALDRFGERAIKTGMPLATMEEVLVPLYMHHRFQVTAAASALGGMHYIYGMRGDGRVPVRPVPASEQNAALAALLATLDPEELAVPKSVLDKMPPRPPGYRRTRELFPRYTGLMFDVISPAMVAADHTVSEILNASRAARIVEQNALNASIPGLDAVLNRLIDGTFGIQTSNGYHSEISRAIERVVVDRMIGLAGSATMPQVRSITAYRLEALGQQLSQRSGDTSEMAHCQALARDITRFLEQPGDAVAPPVTLAAPPGAPIGQPAMNWLQALEPACSLLEW
ncbi:MAG: zinc-dependent metalloprotease [Gemmatimonadota bacterium]|nr:zinc-dependent metalloprotease [Gemmatimonadota bacterium]